MSLLGYCSSHIHKSDLADAHFRFSRTSFSVDEDAGLLSGSITLDTSGQIDQEILVVVQTVAGTATGKYMHALDYFIFIYLHGCIILLIASTLCHQYCSTTTMHCSMH